MKKYYLLLTTFLFTACMDSAKPVVLDKEYERYGAIQNSCLKIINDETPHCEEEHCDVLPLECKEFIQVLDGANEALIKMKKNKENAAFYAAKEKYKKEKNRLKLKHRHLNLLIKNQALDAIEEDDLKQFKELVTFSYHPMNLTYYNYMKKNMPYFEDINKYYHFEKKFASKNYKKGYSLVNRGKYTEGLNHLELASKMKNEKASRLCGDVYTYLYPLKAKECYLRGVEQGDDHMKLLLAMTYENEKNTKEAYKWFETSAKAGNFIAQYKLYDLDNNKNHDWLIKAAASGYDVAQYVYGMTLFNNKEYAQAKKYLQAAAEQNYILAYYPLGKLYFSQKSYKKAFAYLSKGDAKADSMYKLGYMKEYGKGTSKNYYTASSFYTKAKQLGKANVQKDINRMNKAKKRLRKAQMKSQKSSAKASYAKINAKARLREQVEQEDRRIKAQWDMREKEAKQLKASACGNEPTTSILKSRGTRVHLQGTMTHWLGKTSFIVSAGGKEYYIMDENDDARLNKGDRVNMVAVTTGRREITHGLKRSVFDEADEAAIQKAYALDYEGVCPY